MAIHKALLPSFSRLAVAGGVLSLPLVVLASGPVPQAGSATPPQAIPTAAGTPSDADVLLNLFQKKGLISEQDVKDAHAALAAHNSAASVDGKTVGSMPEWVTGLKFSGDFRGRFEENNADNTAYSARDRYRYRVRVGAAVSMLDNFEVGVRLASGNPQTNPGGTLVGGQPITANQDLGSLESRKFLWIDAAYAKWTPIQNEDWRVSGTIGKMDNPFRLSNMVWDYDINPEGAATEVTYNLSDKHTLRGIGAFVVLDEINQGVGAVPSISPSHDPFIIGAQVQLESKWTPRLQTTLSVAAFDIANRDSLSAKTQPFYNSGNTRDATTGLLVHNYNPIVASAAATYRLDSFPLYPGKFPIKAIAEYMENPGAPANNRAFRLGGTLGQAGKKGLWQIDYRYQRLEADAWFDALEDDDNGAYYATGNPQLAGTGKANGWFGGTNVKGHLVQATYSFTDFLNFQFTCYLNDLIINAPGQSSGAMHFMLDLNWRF